MNRFSCLRRIQKFLVIASLLVTVVCFSLPFCLDRLTAPASLSPHLYSPSGGKGYLLPPSLSSSSIQLGIVVCGGNKNTTDEIVEEVATLVKSVIISAKIHNSTNKITFHIFTDGNPVENALYAKLKVYSLKMGRWVRFKVKFYNVSTSLPKNYLEQFILTPEGLDCFCVRLFFPEALPKLEEILYVDTDVLIIGSIDKIWEHFRNTKDKEIVTLVPNNEPSDTNYPEIDRLCFGGIPHVPPEGVNAGVMYMNLKGLRDFNFSQQVIKHHSQAVGVNFTRMWDQRIINIIFHYNPDYLKLLPCHYNFQHLHCEKGLTCQDAVEDSGGVQVLHGAGQTFQGFGSHFGIYRAYMAFDFEHHNIVEDLMRTVKGLYTDVKTVRTCDGQLGPLLFKDLVGSKVSIQELNVDMTGFQKRLDYEKKYADS